MDAEILELSAKSRKFIFGKLTFSFLMILFTIASTDVGCSWASIILVNKSEHAARRVANFFMRQCVNLRENNIIILIFAGFIQI